MWLHWVLVAAYRFHSLPRDPTWAPCIGARVLTTEQEVLEFKFMFIHKYGFPFR